MPEQDVVKTPARVIVTTLAALPFTEKTVSSPRFWTIWTKERVPAREYPNKLPSCEPPSIAYQDAVRIQH
jgi:hypothetical protein